MPRQFENFLSAYETYADNGFTPPQFNRWTCLSILAGALERRVWLPWSDSYSFYPNIYVLLVSMPGDGKSVALNSGVGLLQEVNRRTSSLNIMPNQVTEAKFIELMGHGRTFTDRHTGKEMLILQNAGYYFASEASNSLKNVFGDFLSCLTDFYDCPNTWERATKKDGKKISLKNVCMNLIAGSTFDYLGKLVNDVNIMGGFASRLIYVVSKNKEVVDQEFQMGGQNAVELEERRVYREALVADLTAISKLVGPFRAEPDFGAAWRTWYMPYEKKRRALQSEKAQSLLARTNTNVLKVAMLLCVAESDDLVLKLRHWEKALEWVSAIQEEAPAIFRQARATSSTSGGPTQIPNAILHIIEKAQGQTIEQIRNTLKMMLPGASREIETALQGLIGSGVISDGGREAKILKDPNNYL